MSNFRDYLKQDINNVFLNTNEFAELVTINGTKVSASIDKDKLEYKLSKDTSGILHGDMLIFISDTEYAKVPRVQHPPRTGDAVFINGKTATITSVGEDFGMYEIIIEFSGVR